MKVLFITSSMRRGGVEEYILKFCRAFVKKRWDIHVAFPCFGEAEAFINDFTKEGVDCHPLKISEQHSKKFIFLQLYRILVLLIKIRPDIAFINLPNPRHCFGAIIACAFLNVPTLITFHLIPRKFSFKKIKLVVYKWAHSRRQQWLTVSENNRNYLCESFRVSKDKVNVVYNGVSEKSDFANLTYEQIQRFRLQLCSELGISETAKLLLTVGRLSKPKGYSDLASIVASVVKEFPEVKFLWVGTGREKDILVGMLKKHGIENRVFFLGYRLDVAMLLKSADLFIFPTYHEGFPLALLEAMVYGLPIVSSDASSILEIIENNVHGLMFPVGNTQVLLENILWALKNPESMQKMADNARMRVQDFSEEKMVEETLNKLESLCRK